MSTEIWKPVVGREGEYEVSSLGRVRSLDRELIGGGRWGGLVIKKLRGKILAQSPHWNEYRTVSLGRGRSYLVHRLVAEAFVSGSSKELQVNHKNSVRTDNRPENLEWVTCSENHLHAHKKHGRKQHVWTTPCTLVGPSGTVEFESQLAAAKWLGVVPGSVRSAATHAHKCRGWEVRV